ncbi:MULTISPECIES: hypothetical protein [Burkholderia]|nr:MULTISPECIES: hypothetical protein [Burkholderia]
MQRLSPEISMISSAGSGISVRLGRECIERTVSTRQRMRVVTD